MTVITSSPTQFGKLLDIQKGALDQLITIRQIAEHSKTIQSASATPAGPSASSVKQTEEVIKITKEHTKVKKDQLQLDRNRLKKMDEEAKIIAQLVHGFKTYKSLTQKLEDSFRAGVKAFNNPGRSLMKMLNIGGVFNKQIAKSEFVEKQKALGSTKTDKELKQDFESANKAAIKVQENEKKLEDLKKKTGLTSESMLAKTPEGRKLLDERVKTTAEYKKFDIGAQLESGSPTSKAPITSLTPAAPIAEKKETPTQAFASAGEQQEMQQENAKLMGDQTDLLKQIEENTRPGGKGVTPAPSESGGGGGLLGGIGAGLGALGKGLGKGMESLLGGVGKGLMRLSVGLATLANPLTLAGLAAATVAIMGIGKALEWAAPAIEAFAPVLMKVAEVIGEVFVKAIETIPKVISAIGDVIIGVISTISESIIGIVDAVTSSIERLAAIDGSALLSVAGGLLALSGAMVAFGGSQALAGLGALVGKLLSFGQDSPVEQLIKIGQNGEGVLKAAEGMEKISTAMVGFNKVDSKAMDILDDFPWAKATKFVAAGGAMSMAGAKVYNVSKTNADEEAKVAGAAKGGGNTVVSAPTVNNTTRQTNVIRVPVRNKDNSVAAWLQSRYTG